MFKSGGWQEDDQLQIDLLDAGLVELKIDDDMSFKGKERRRFKAHVYQCDMPMHKYRGGNLDKFFDQQVLEKAEQCFTYDEKLQGKNTRIKYEGGF